MLIEHGTVAILDSDWEAVRGGDVAARLRVKQALQGVHSYFHNLTFSDDDRKKGWTLVSVVTLMDLGIVESITLDTGV